MRSSDHWHPAHLRALRDLTPTVREFEIRPEGGVRPWTVGSHLNVRVTIDGREDTRSYSLTGQPHDPVAREVYRIAVKRVEPGRGGSRHLWSLERGAELMVGEPANHFELPLGAPQYLLIAGGIGITPIVGMAQQLAAQGADLRLLYAARSADELAFADALGPALGARLRTFVNAQGERLDPAAHLAALHPQALLLCCGPLPLLDAVRAAWSAAGRPAANLRFETFGNTGAHASEAFWVRLPRHGLELTVPADRTLLDVLEAAGVETLHDCKRGECGLCAVDVLAVDGRIDHRDVFFSAHEKAEGRRLCACVSRVTGGGLVLDSSYRPD
ncbi:PDR/VanB family oxidoreductase [Rhizobacter sp. Root404]|uniref:PDR/VanB family oxidoreductase n=1 Tax=Rhizobacter sp. Root404 TaxID=1736528 RepID=UPI0006FC79BC|nr:PDR/VanB family oxidoreductase [Rhizobacter sp. Root404]KQW38786.1 diguanylate cyclase [Rhizobacter sp. Root404]